MRSADGATKLNDDGSPAAAASTASAGAPPPSAMLGRGTGFAPPRPPPPPLGTGGGFMSETTKAQKCEMQMTRRKILWLTSGRGRNSNPHRRLTQHRVFRNVEGYFLLHCTRFSFVPKSFLGSGCFAILVYSLVAWNMGADTQRR
jgi:hypothetical protein